MRRPLPLGFSREGITKTIAYLQQLDAAGVKFKSLTEPLLDLDNELVAHILLGVLSYFTQLEASKISSRTRAGLERVRAQGKTLGRPDGFTLHGPVFTRMKAEGYSQGRITRETGLAINTVKGYLKRLEGLSSISHRPAFAVLRDLQQLGLVALS